MYLQPLLQSLGTAERFKVLYLYCSGRKGVWVCHFLAEGGDNMANYLTEPLHSSFYSPLLDLSGKIPFKEYSVDDTIYGKCTSSMGLDGQESHQRTMHCWL